MKKTYCLVNPINFFEVNVILMIKPEKYEIRISLTCKYEITQLILYFKSQILLIQIYTFCKKKIHTPYDRP